MSVTSVACTAPGQPGAETPTSRGPVDRLESVFDRCAGSLYRYVLVRVGGDAHLADDILQQLWCQACAHGGRVPIDELEYWMRAVAKNLVRTHWRRVGRRPAHCSFDSGGADGDFSRRLVEQEMPLEQLAGTEARELLLRAITTLSVDDQELVVEHYFNDCSHSELAGRLGLTERAVEGRLYRARQSLRRKLVRGGEPE